ncbi:Xaa-Pro peptidase family protein [Paraburkholderia caribensis]|uniref:Peptidase M24 n=2 Tax=Paraburkholderia TaxID=1822464 RepID=B2JYG5_PARP8|nr:MULTISPECIES: Xaa-Pro peptidase family protein [Paraburkholderia]ACC76673.1 peptidase M24 [Paraburkholderia phymatum STM815]MCO4882301.1 Xaa-Pro peptidase family protein [Paraburkholderia caribensis]PTB24425.1 aminopeptidase P family protein [Paraburkholderia caribensis]
MDEYAGRVGKLRDALRRANIDVALISDPDSVAYFGGFWNYLGVEFGRPTLMVISQDHEPVLITPLMESEMCGLMTWVKDIRPWGDGIDDEWRKPLREVLQASKAKRVGIERAKMPPLVSGALPVEAGSLTDVGQIIFDLRTIKSGSEIAVMRQAGQVAVAMVEAAKEVIREGVPEYEIALAVIAGGTRKAASFLDEHEDRFVSPTIYNLQILQSGRDVCLVHRRSSVRTLKRGDPVYLCFCGIANFKNYKLGFDREFFVGSVTDEQARVYEAAVAAQQAALAQIKPGVRCEDVNAAAEEVYRDAGFAPGYRTGRSIGYSFLETPELKRGEQRTLEAGMTFAVDGGITIEGEFGGRVGDSIVVTADGFEYLTDYPRKLTVV